MKISQKILTQKSLGLMAESEQNTSGRILRYFALETNIEGINNAGRSRSLIRASVWLGIFVSLVALTISDMNDLIKEFASQPVDVSTTLEHENAIDFPSVTVCNKNKVSCRRLAELLQHCQALPQCKHPAHLQKLHQLGRCDVSTQLVPAFHQGDTVSHSLLDIEPIKDSKPVVTKSEIISDILDSFQEVNQSAEFRADQEFLGTFLQLSREEQFLIGHQFSDMIKSCTFRGVDCLAMLGSDEMKVKFLDYEVVMSPTHGNCFSLYTVSQALGRSSLTGSTYGLSLVVKVEQSDYLRGGQTLAAGARVTVQDREAPPLIDEYGLDIAPGSLTSLALQLVNITRHQYSGCNQSSSYSITSCQKQCIQRSVMDTCGCYHPLYQVKLGGTLPPCDLVSEAKDQECVIELIVKFDTGLLQCDCLPACWERDYEKLVSSTVWPATHLANTDSDDYLKLDVYFMSLNVKSITETARYTTASFISTLGGSLGAWLGFSVCMIFEVLELVLDLTIHSLL